MGAKMTTKSTVLKREGVIRSDRQYPISRTPRTAVAALMAAMFSLASVASNPELVPTETGIEAVETPGSVEPSVSEEAPATESSLAPVEPEPELADLGVQAYMMKCVGCHTIGGGALSGPDLKPMVTWPRTNLSDAIKRMEKNVGPLPAEEVALYTDFLLDEEAAQRLLDAQQLVALQQAASLDPANAEVGEQLFFGSRAFAQGGLACAACHQAGGRGGSMAASLEDAFTRIGEVPLIATCENPGYPVMRTIYTEHPLSKQESVHVVKYLEAVAATPRARGFMPLHAVATGGAIAVLLAIGGMHRNRQRGTRARLVAEAHRKTTVGSSFGRVR
jgi:hypothetical protein